MNVGLKNFNQANGAPKTFNATQIQFMRAPTGKSGAPIMNLQIPGQPTQQIQLQGANLGPRSNSGNDPRLAANSINIS